MASISRRLHMKWANQPPSEPTSTLVLSTPGNRYIDIRILTSSPHGQSLPVPNNGAPLSQLDWAFAGTSTRQKLEGGNVWCKWEHWVDSRVPVGQDSEADQGTICPSADPNISFEYGEMWNPATGIIEAYEEKWVDEEVRRVGREEGKVAVVATLDRSADGVRGVVVRVGQFCQGLLKIGEEVTVERWEWVEGKGKGKGVERVEVQHGEGEGDGNGKAEGEGSEGDWTRTVRIGSRFLPCAMAFKAELLSVGQALGHGELVWCVQEVERWD